MVWSLVESNPYVLRRVFEVRSILEKLSPQTFPNSPLLSEAYGRNLYKCPFIKCSRFQRGFADCDLRNDHLRSHKRAYKCTVEGCDYLEIGFPTNTDLTRHQQLCHCESDEDFTFPSVKRASLSQTLKHAIDRDDTSTVRNLCAEMLTNPINETGFLLRAVKRKSFGAASALLELLGSAETNHKAKDGRTVLHEAAETVDVIFLDKILSTDVDVNAEDRHHRTPLSIALEQGQFDAARLLWSASDGKPRISKNGWIRAAWRKGLLEASSGGHDDIVLWIFRTLVEHFTPRSSYLSVAIYQAVVRAASKDHQTTVQIILDTGRALDLEKGYSGRLKEVLCKGIKAIKLEQPEVDGKGKTKGNALAHAAQRDDSERVLRLLRDGADIDYSSKTVRTALQAAAKHGRLSMVHLLLDKGADINAQGGRCGNALQAASYQGHKDVIAMLLNNGVDVNAQGGQFGNALQAASWKCYKDVVEILLNNGAEVNARGGYYGNALKAAQSRQQFAIVEMLRQHGAKDVSL